MTVTIASDLIDRILHDAATSPMVEICGLLFGSEGAVTAAQSCRNVAADPSRWFEIDPVALIAAHRRAREGGPRLLGHYHSHPGGVPMPSPRDAAHAVADGTLWLIAGSGEVRCWRAVDDGTVEGRFDPVTMIPAP
ncbi:M67 family metallopeptidase [Sphingomonas sp. Leaf37]|uniref:M67 family metallopeptidase n=1 Tax=Sphingomonas sp. Leaf37 TaxID=2876552 RepID=UPI001E4417BB|nr:M67 family metallopeptidase [Sphingomonas sp. Leaf37]